MCNAPIADFRIAGDKCSQIVNKQFGGVCGTARKNQHKNTQCTRNTTNMRSLWWHQHTSNPKQSKRLVVFLHKWDQIFQEPRNGIHLATGSAVGLSKNNQIRNKEQKMMKAEGRRKQNTPQSLEQRKPILKWWKTLWRKQLTWARLPCHCSNERVKKYGGEFSFGAYNPWSHMVSRSSLWYASENKWKLKQKHWARCQQLEFKFYQQ